METEDAAPARAQVAIDAAGVTGRAPDADEAGQAVRAVRAAAMAQIARGGGEEIRAQQRADAGRAVAHCAKVVVAEPERHYAFQFGDPTTELA
ncbi:hypothetical protein [Streptomyces sp. NPDC088762]|uniref:hypothetical protein n=1 Tax=Streptomyces sp. NPDC088762 TaxID=3365891 RepID=UPI00382BD7F4